MIEAIAIDDEPLALRVIENFCQKRTDIRLVKTFSSQADAFKHLRDFPVDLLFLDIQMPGLSGLDFAKRITGKPLIIFTTAFSEYAVEGFDIQAIDYLLKPYSEQRFHQAVDRAGQFLKGQVEADEEQFLFLRADYSLFKISLANILYIEGLGDYLKIFIENQKTLVVRMTMKNILEKLPTTDFIRVHRSFIVPLSRIESVRHHIIKIGSAEIPVGKKFEDELFSRIKK